MQGKAATRLRRPIARLEMRQLELLPKINRVNSKEEALHKIAVLLQALSKERELDELETQVFLIAQTALTPHLEEKSMLSYLG